MLLQMKKIKILRHFADSLTTNMLGAIVKKYVKKAHITRAISPYCFRRFVGIEMIPQQ